MAFRESRRWAACSKFSDSDAMFQIGSAIGALNCLENGIYIAMNGNIFPADKVKRNMKTGQFIEV